MNKNINDSIVTLQNSSSVLAIDLFGGAITDFHLNEGGVNPLSFRFSKKQMPPNNKAGATYKGHFACIGRWGEPSAGEIKKGLPNHGEAANLVWQTKGNKSATLLTMEVNCESEGLHVNRTISLDRMQSLYHVKETITNKNVLGRLYNIVQHPTIAAPFLSDATIINCNAAEGFEYRNVDQYKKYLVNFPMAKDENDKTFNLSNPKRAYGSVFSFVIKQDETFGWIIAFSPAHDLLVGYVWPRKQYPWISLWQHFENDKIKYRGLEFGSTGIHQSFKNIIEKNLLTVLDERTALFIDAGEKQTFEYAGFLCKTTKSFAGVINLNIDNDNIYLNALKSNEQIFLGKIKFS